MKDKLASVLGGALAVFVFLVFAKIGIANLFVASWGIHKTITVYVSTDDRAMALFPDGNALFAQIGKTEIKPISAGRLRGTMASHLIGPIWILNGWPSFSGDWRPFRWELGTQDGNEYSHGKINEKTGQIDYAGAVFSKQSPVQDLSTWGELHDRLFPGNTESR